MREAADHDGSAVFLGRLLPHKGVPVLLEGLPPNVLLHVIGAAPDLVYLEQLQATAAGKAVEFHLGLSDREVLVRLRAAMALVHPTPVDAAGSPGVNELFGLALVEAMACGCPVIASDVPPLSEIVIDGVCGLLVPPNDPSAIAAALSRLATDHDLWRRLSAGARVRVSEQFAWERVVDRCLAAYSAEWNPR
jgi:starch synthase